MSKSNFLEYFFAKKLVQNLVYTYIIGRLIVIGDGELS